MSSRSICKVILIGNLGSDPEVRYTQNSKPIANFSVATTEAWKDKQTGEQKEETEWNRCVAYGRLAEIVGEYVKKGAKVYVEGRLKTRKWQGQDGVERYTTEIIANDVQMLDSPKAANSQNGYQQQNGQQQQQQFQQQPQQQFQQQPNGNRPQQFQQQGFNQRR